MENSEKVPRFSHEHPGTKEHQSLNPTDVDEIVARSDTAAFEEAPDGGLRAWLVAIGAACVFFSTLGFANSFGVFQEYYLNHQLREKSPDDIAWIGSLSAFLQFAAGAIGGPLFDRIGAWMMWPAAVFYVVAVMMTSLCSEYWHFMLAQGVLMGISMGFLQFPALAAVSQHFDKRRAAALGVTISGSSIGGVVIPLALSKMLNSSSLSFAWAVRIIGFVTIPLLAFACVAVRSRLPPRATIFFIGAALKDARYTLLVASLFAMLLGMFTPLFFIPTYAVTRGVNTNLASNLLAIINAASTFGRIIPGVLADKFGHINVFSFAGVSTGIIIFCMSKAESTTGLVLYSIAVGFASGAIISGASAAFTLCPKDPRDFGTYLGTGMAIGSIAILIGPPINGALVDRYDGFSQASVFSGTMCVLGGCVALASKLIASSEPVSQV